MRLLQSHEVSTESIEFHCITKPARCLLPPRIKRRRAGEVVKRIVDLNRVEAFGVVGKPSRFGQLLRVEDPAPVVVMVAGSTDSGGARMRHQRKSGCAADEDAVRLLLSHAGGAQRASGMFTD
jgi:hypothetical protein